NGNPISKTEARAIIFRDYPSKKAKQKKEKALLAFSTRQSFDSSKSHIEPLPHRTIESILSTV
ncbi:MAG: hypothetical protein ABH952_01345, partial [Candidatus Omnitrophota bacterium]